MLPDPTRLTQDDADAITVIRNEMRSSPLIPLAELEEQVARRRRQTNGRLRPGTRRRNRR